MRSIKEIQSEIVFIQSNLNPHDEERIRIAFLNKCLLILKSASKEYLDKEYERLKKIVDGSPTPSFRMYFPPHLFTDRAKAAKRLSMIRYILEK